LQFCLEDLLCAVSPVDPEQRVVGHFKHRDSHSTVDVMMLIGDRSGAVIGQRWKRNAVPD